MALHHVPTFLRSAIVRDPFCHGGIITPEDVLRLEAKFPTLFDKPAPSLPTFVAEPKGIQPSDEDDSNNEAGDDLVKEKKKVTTAGKRNPKTVPANKATYTKDNKVNTTRKKIEQRTQLPAQRRKPSEYHKRCIETVPPPVESMKQSKKVPVGSNVAKPKFPGSSKLTRPAQSFSLEDLRATLRQVMEEDALQQNKWQRPDNLPSPYTEDLVKKFLGWKMKQNEMQNKTMRNRNANSLVKIRAQGDSTARLKAITDAIAAYHDGASMRQTVRNRLTAHTTPRPGESRKEKAAVPRVRSAPGFLRGISELPPVPNYQKKRMMLSMARGDKPPRRLPDVEHLDEVGGLGRNQGGGDGESRRKQVRWEREGDEPNVGFENNERSEKDHPRSDESSCDESYEHAAVHKLKRSGMRGTQINLSSQKNPLSVQESPEATFGNDERYKIKSSYQDLLDARSEKTRYEVKGFLRKQEVACNFYKKQQERERTEKKTLRAKHEYFREIESSSEPSEAFARKMQEMGQRSNEETRKALEIMAKELVYLEVLHQINELKQEQKDGDLEMEKRQLLHELRHLPSSTSSSPRQKPNKTSEIVLPNFVPTSTDQDNSGSGEQKIKRSDGGISSLEIILKTPELTPPSTEVKGKKHLPESKKGPRANEKVDIISLHTPQLSPSPRRLIAAIKEKRELEKKLLESPPQQHQQLDTDCSEMSDFVFSEPIGKEGKGKNIPVVHEEESVPLETPQLSSAEDNKHSKNEPEQTPEKDGSTLSAVPSTLLETPSESQKSQNPGVEDSEKASVNYSDDFTPENASNLASPPPIKHTIPFKMISDDDVKSQADTNDHLNTSGETVIDMLSEGEFIGPSYRSPGELSWRQKTRPRPLPQSSSNPSIAASSSNRQRFSVHSSSFEQQQQESFKSSTVKGTKSYDEESISVLSFGAQIAPGNGQRENNVSVGEYLNG